MDKQLWEILVPKYSNKRIEYALEYHTEWDNKVRDIAGGLTIMKKSRGHWISPEGKTHIEEMIPVRIYCNEKTIDDIIDMTLKHYDQEAVMAYLVSEKVKIKYNNNIKKPRRL